MLSNARDVDTNGRGSTDTISADRQAGAADGGTVLVQTDQKLNRMVREMTPEAQEALSDFSGGSRAGTGGNTGRLDEAASRDEQPADNAGAAGGTPGQSGTGDAGANANAGDDGVSGRPATDGKISPSFYSCEASNPAFEAISTRFFVVRGPANSSWHLQPANG